MEEYIQKYLCVVIGILISFLLPILRAMLPELPTKGDRKEFIKKNINPYLIIAGFSLVAAILVVAGLAPDIDCRGALLAGYAVDSTFQKMKGPTGTFNLNKEQ